MGLMSLPLARTGRRQVKVLVKLETLPNLDLWLEHQLADRSDAGHMLNRFQPLAQRVNRIDGWLELALKNQAHNLPVGFYRPHGRTDDL